MCCFLPGSLDAQGSKIFDEVLNEMGRLSGKVQILMSNRILKSSNLHNLIQLYCTEFSVYMRRGYDLLRKVVQENKTRGMKVITLRILAKSGESAAVVARVQLRRW